ncbi:synembryn-A [Micropterus dolomieu]|uniref:synembryn-A n=1 Tax=Micropterus dolomieu TaxID=147949 RepID=UPI001E8EE6AA|nr:synembryn-A [Micropterus dolomieu]XP_045925383.1 synembryn-A [Micropterus dolomieu]XP_045925384.1 synembryn-A [Micropterus dolomieu]XP_045925385.1 synembryn-A [Micropterus dolomieu]XP_045925386.1 synembryn-A [Micropterus dolomieu]XP_045925387.1 synembryn-A [Micropterus dolomieu]XP_045925388.1 synembryn-A [Micropterus dolomieu]XP_045925389.1 synembryn-A [Micropterus dolomieu]XP_045925390.1 synembryn-A [Micropterus dolomieu]
MDVDLEGIIQCIKQGDENGVQTQLQEFNKEYAQCFFFDAEERDRRKQRKLEEFRNNKVREYTDSDSDCDEYNQEDRGLILRQNLVIVLLRFIRTGVKCRLLRVSLRTLRILSRDKKVLSPLVTDGSLLTVAKLAGLTTCDTSDEASDPDSDFYDNIIASLTEAKVLQCHTDEDEGDVEASDQNNECSAFDEDAKSNVSITTSGDLDSISWFGSHRTSINEMHRGSIHHKELERGRRDRRESKMEGQEEGEEEEDGEPGEEAQRKEAMKVLCNVVYNSTWAQERFSALRLMCGLIECLSSSVSCSSPSSVQFYELRLMFLVTALRPELRTQLQQEGGVSILTAALESCLEVQWKDQYECVLSPEAPPISLEASQRIIEILKILFNITYSTHRQEPSEDDAALYRHLVALLRLCLMRKCTLSDDADELQGHTVNLLSALPLQCLDVLLRVPLEPDSQQYQGVNMDCVHALVLFMERRLDSGDKIKEKLTPILNLLTESCRAHRETRRYIRKHILPPLRDVSHRPEEGSTVKSRLIRLMTHLDTDLKHCAADLIFVLCKENVSRFVKYTGYGNAAGLLATRGLLGGGSRTPSSDAQYSSDSDSDTEEYRQVKDRVNPVTGRVETEQPDPMEGMTEEEKEEEARRLITLFNKLSRDNIIQPMEVDSEGKLVPMSGLRENSLTEEGKSESGVDGETEEGEKD